jgi:polyadenylate-binding protein
MADHDIQQPEADQGIPQPHPYLHEPLLYISNLPPYVTDQSLAVAFVSCGPFRPKILRDGSNMPLSGTIEFKFIEKAEKALATLQSRPIPELQPLVPLVLSPYPPTNPPTPLPPPSALPRLVKHLPFGYTDAQLYDIFRPFGAIASARTQAGFGPDTGMVEFWREGDARVAEDAMHCVDVEGQNIAVQIYQPRRTSGNVDTFSASAPAFVPSSSIFPYPTQYSPPRASPYPVRSPVQPVAFVHGPGQQVQLAPLVGPGSNSHSGLIDPCNLFCKNLDPEIDSNGLFTHFREFGQIVSARVMRNENGDSRGFGFVSYQMPDQASAAMHAMNGMQLGSKQVVVRLHEPKQLRQEKLAQRFGHNGHPRNSSGATSPTASEGGESYAGWSSPRHHPAALGSPVGSHYERGRRGSGSYYNAALSGTLNLPMRYDELSTLSPVVRKEVLTGELSRRVKALDSVPAHDVDSVVESLVGLSLSEVVQGIHDPAKLADQVNTLKNTLKPSQNSSPDKSPARSASASQDSRLLDPNALNATASAPEHPSTPISVSASLSTPPRTSSPSGSVPPTSERDRMVVAVGKFESTRQNELTDLLMSLPKRERAMCLFNIEVLRAKIADAKNVLDSDEAEADAHETAVDAQSVKSAPQAPVTPQGTRTMAVQDSPQTPDLSSRGPSATSSPVPGTPSGTAYTIASLARLPAAEIVKIATSSSATGLPLPKPDPLVVKATDEFIDALVEKPIQTQKQQVGDKLWRVIKAFGIKGAPKLTITLLDQDDLRALAHLMNSYPSVLKEKALLVQASTATK